jgi:hypothetical protein
MVLFPQTIYNTLFHPAAKTTQIVLDSGVILSTNFTPQNISARGSWSGSISSKSVTVTGDPQGCVLQGARAPAGRTGIIHVVGSPPGRQHKDLVKCGAEIIGEQNGDWTMRSQSQPIFAMRGKSRHCFVVTAGAFSMRLSVDFCAPNRRLCRPAISLEDTSLNHILFFLPVE